MISNIVHITGCITAFNRQSKIFFIQKLPTKIKIARENFKSQI